MSDGMQVFAGAESLAQAAAGQVAALLAEALALRPLASLVVPGGRTPARFLALLSQADLDWSRVRVSLSDERWVPADRGESNESLVRRTLLTGPAASAAFLSLYTGAPSPEAGREEAEKRLEALPRPVDALVLGMGEDGHFASLFPGEEGLFDPRVGCVAAAGPAGGPPRLSLTLPFLLESRRIFVLATGQGKRALWARAHAEENSALPVSILQRRVRCPLDFLWAEETP